MITTRGLAAEIGCDKSTVTRWAQRLALGKLIGTARTFTAAEARQIARLVHDQPGNPTFGAVKK